MNKTETGAAGVKAAYVCPRIARYATKFESSLCAETSIGGGHDPAHPEPNPLEPDDDGQ